MNILPSHALSPTPVRELAYAAAERGEQLGEANPFKDEKQRALFAAAFREREADLQPAN